MEKGPHDFPLRTLRTLSIAKWLCFAFLLFCLAKTWWWAGLASFAIVVIIARVELRLSHPPEWDDS